MSSSDKPLSLSPSLQPEYEREQDPNDEEMHSDSSIISEHLNSNSDSIENDRSYQEIEISNVPSNFSLLLENLAVDDDEEHISQEIKPFLITSAKSSFSSLSTIGKLDKTTLDMENNVVSILDEILRSEQFKSSSEQALNKTLSVQSNESSFNIFEGIDLNDSLINEYDTKMDSNKRGNQLISINVATNLPLDDRNVGTLSIIDNNKLEEDLQVKRLQELLSTKETTIAALAAELESLRELTSSNQSTLSLSTSTTDYKLYQDEFHNKIVEFQNALSHRDTVIQQLTEAFQQSVLNREQLQEQSEYFSKEIAVLQKQLAETSAIISQHTWKEGDGKKSLRKDNVILPLTTSSVNVVCVKEKENDDLSIEKQGGESPLTIGKGTEEDKLANERKDCEVDNPTLPKVLTHLHSNSDDFEFFKQELEGKHAKELEELRTYFEQKCADLEKHYSEEVFSQQSRRMSESSSGSEASDYNLSGRHPLPGPGGDMLQIPIDISKIDLTNRNFSLLNQKDLIKLRSELTNIVSELGKYNLENISKHDINVITLELNKYDLRCLLKYDLSAIKAEMQNKYHAELEILREDYENRIDASDVEHNLRMESIEQKYINKIKSLKLDLDEALRFAHLNSSSTAIQEVASSGEYELAEVVQSYERRLQEQVTLAKIDIINALELQIQMLVTNTADDAEWPTELLQLRNRFTKKSEKQLSDLEERHQEEMAQLREEHRKMLAGILGRAQRRNSKNSDGVSLIDLEIIKERDGLKKTTVMLRHLITELMKYFTDCEEELNNTLIDELLKPGYDETSTDLGLQINMQDSSNYSIHSDSLTIKKRVHLAPKFEELLATIDNSPSSTLESNISVELKNELGTCLKRLREDANAILVLSTNSLKGDNKNLDMSEGDSKTTVLLENRILSLKQQLFVENELKNGLGQELSEAKKLIGSLERERSNLDEQVEQFIAEQKVLDNDLRQARDKISELIENGHTEIISEGYGEIPKLGDGNFGSRLASLAELQERARSMAAECSNSGNNPLLQLVDDLCREGNRITEDAKKDRKDLQQQIEAADKKLRATCHFLEEQAAEREQERDEAQKQITCLHEQLREREKDRVSCERISKEVEHLEQQLRIMSTLIDENELKYNEVESEKREAIEKIFVLRDIIRDLESQVEIKTIAETELKTLLAQFQEVITQQNKTTDELTRQLDAVKNISDAKHVRELEEEVQRLRVNTELAGSEGTIKQIKTQLNEFEISIDKRTRDLEALHSAISTTSCSSPSEDMSLRDQIKTSSAFDECDVPLQQLVRLKEKLLKHSRAEDAAVKRIRDLEMELEAHRHELDEMQNERDILQDQVSEQLVLISSLQIRLDDQRLHAEQVQKQNNSSLEVRIYDLENEIKNSLETINVKDKAIKQLTKTIEETKKRLKDQEKELHDSQENETVTALQREIQQLRNENASLLTKINNDAQNAQVLPNLVDNILADKNKDIEMLREKLDKTQGQLNSYLSLNLDHQQLMALSKLQSSERAFTDILSLTNLNVLDQTRHAPNQVESLEASFNINPLGVKQANQTEFMGSVPGYEPEISSIELLGHPNINYSVHAPLTKPNSTELYKSVEKRVHFDESIYNTTIEKLRTEILELKNELFSRNELIGEYTERLEILNKLEVSIQNLQAKLNFTEKALQSATDTFEKEQNALKEVERNLKVDLAEKKMHLIVTEKKLVLAEEDSSRKDEMYMNLAKEKRGLEKALNQLQESKTLEKNKKINAQLSEFNEALKKIESLETELETTRNELKVLNEECLKLRHDNNVKIDDLSQLKRKLAQFNQEMKQKDDLNIKMTKDLKNMESQISYLTNEIELLKQVIEDKNKEIETCRIHMDEEERKSLMEMEAKIKELKAIITDRETEIEILNEDVSRYQDDMAQLENKVRSTKNSVESDYELKLAQSVRDIAAKDLEMVKLTTDVDDSNREIRHLRELLNKKDKIISQMSDDSKSLHANLETIQAKMREAGNVVDLKERLEDEKQLNASLKEELRVLKGAASEKSVDMAASIEEITGAVRKQLDYSASLDHSILNALSAGDNEFISTLTETNDAQLLKQTLAKERRINLELKMAQENLEQNLKVIQVKHENEKENVHQLRILLESEKENLNTVQLEDANILEQLRLRLEATLKNEAELQKLIDIERRVKKELEVQVATLKNKLINAGSGENSKTELTEYKSLPNIETEGILRLQKDIQILHVENSRLKNDLKNLKRDKSEMEANLKYAKDTLTFRIKDAVKLEEQIHGLRETEALQRENLMVFKTELDQRNREVENSRLLLNEIEQEKREMRNEISRLSYNLENALGRENRQMEESKQKNLKNLVPDKFLHKMKELENLVREHMNDNTVLSDVVNKLTDERRMLQEKIGELEESQKIQMPFDDPVARANHLFARYLRSESFRKALIWQKNYLVLLLASYQTYPLFSKELPLPNINFAVANNPVRSTGVSRFKTIAISIIAIIRMQFLVQRWHSGKRAMRSHHYYRAPPTKIHQCSTMQFHVGQPVSSQNFPIQQVSPATQPHRFYSTDPKFSKGKNSTSWPLEILNDVRRPTTPTSPVNLGPWSAMTPPSKDGAPKGRSSENFCQAGVGGTSREEFVPLQAPTLLSHYIDRFDQIQNRLGITLDRNTT